jgi:predicted molibdopterin-dependent oxidoreductase YjgC
MGLGYRIGDVGAAAVDSGAATAAVAASRPTINPINVNNDHPLNTNNAFANHNAVTGNTGNPLFGHDPIQGNNNPINHGPQLTTTMPHTEVGQ